MTKTAPEDTRLPGPADLRAARARIDGRVRRTPVLTSSTLDVRAGARVFLKCENLQTVGAFKFRGALNAVLALPADRAARGVVTHSSGNHGQALARAARERGIPAVVVVPEGAPAPKLAAIAGYGAEVIRCGPTQADREAAATRVVSGRGAHLVHPYDDVDVIAGQGSAVAELLEDVPDLAHVLVPVGGGGLASGTALAVRDLAPGVAVTGAEPAAADDARRSLETGVLQRWDRAPATCADGLRTALSPRTFRALRENLAGIVTVEEDAILAAMRFVWERMKLVIEPSSAVPIAALLEGRVPASGRVGIIVSGGNVDLERLPWPA